ncbi:Lysine methyltransferase [Rhizoctonia solani]|uniref:Lysine methyltransferase n=1 Tax=Rhizoctonia solani TaxID=456999 RepID=A0A8H7IHW5_9AGAM|nr:Lysine methyltransferase [Rhizoctonia solani]
METGQRIVQTFERRTPHRSSTGRHLETLPRRQFKPRLRSSRENSTRDHYYSLVLDFTQPEFGRLPLAVTSLPISVLVGENRETRATRSTPSKQSKVKSKPTEHSVAKQEKIERLYSLPSNWGTLRITEQTSFDLDKWGTLRIRKYGKSRACMENRRSLSRPMIIHRDSGVGASWWLANSAQPESPDKRHELIEAFRTRLQPANQDRILQVIELGAGTGLVSLVLGALFAGYSRNVRNVDQEQEEWAGPFVCAKILATDLSNSHLFDDRINTVEGSEESRRTCKIELHATELTGTIRFPAMFGTQIASRDHNVRLIMADVTYNTASFGALLDTLVGLLQGPSDSGSSPIVLLAYKCRDPAERTLWTDALARGISFVQVDTVKGVREPAVEIWLGGWERDVGSLWSGIRVDM